MMAKAAASLDLLSGGRFELALGAAPLTRRSSPWAVHVAVEARPRPPWRRPSRLFGSCGPHSLPFDMGGVYIDRHPEYDDLVDQDILAKQR